MHECGGCLPPLPLPVPPMHECHFGTSSRMADATIRLPAAPLPPSSTGTDPHDPFSALAARHPAASASPSPPPGSRGASCLDPLGALFEAGSGDVLSDRDRDQGDGRCSPRTLQGSFSSSASASAATAGISAPPGRSALAAAGDTEPADPSFSWPRMASGTQQQSTGAYQEFGGSHAMAAKGKVPVGSAHRPEGAPSWNPFPEARHMPPPPPRLPLQQQRPHSEEQQQQGRQLGAAAVFPDLADLFGDVAGASSPLPDRNHHMHHARSHSDMGPMVPEPAGPAGTNRDLAGAPAAAALPGGQRGGGGSISGSGHRLTTRPQDGSGSTMGRYGASAGQQGEGEGGPIQPRGSVREPSLPAAAAQPRELLIYAIPLIKVCLRIGRGSTTGLILSHL